MFTGRNTKYDPKAKAHTMVINIDRVAGSFTCVVWDGFQADYSRGKTSAYVGRYARGDMQIEVLIYGGKLATGVLTGLLAAFVGGKWVKMSLKELEGGAVIPKHTL